MLLVKKYEQCLLGENAGILGESVQSWNMKGLHRGISDTYFGLSLISIQQTS